MFKSADDLLAYVEDAGVEIIDVRFCDLPGIMQHFTVPVGSFGPEVFEEGLAFDGSSIRGFQKIHESDMALLPDPTTAYIDPFRIAKTLCLNFFVHDPLTKEPYSRDPRNIARKAENSLSSTGSRTRPNRRRRSTRTCTSSPRRSTPRCRPCRTASTACWTAWRPTTTSCWPATSSPPT
jgi:glutamine synthetase